MNIDWHFVLKLLATMALTLFWMFYIVWEIEQRAKEAAHEHESTVCRNQYGHKKECDDVGSDS